MKVTILPPKGKRKTRKQESIKFQVRWQANDSIFFSCFKRDNAAIRFQQELIDDGIPPEMVKLVMI